MITPTTSVLDRALDRAPEHLNGEPGCGEEPGELLTPAEVAALFRVDRKTVTRWATSRRLSCVRTLGGHRRYPAAEVHALLHTTTTRRASR